MSLTGICWPSSLDSSCTIEKHKNCVLEQEYQRSPDLHLLECKGERQPFDDSLMRHNYLTLDRWKEIVKLFFGYFDHCGDLARLANIILG